LKRKRNVDTVITTRLLAFDDFVMTPCTRHLDFDPELASMVAAGLPAQSPVPMAVRYASLEAKSELAMDLVEMALCRIQSVVEALLGRFDGGDHPVPPRTATGRCDASDRHDCRRSRGTT
jgi:hypothetical protein